MPYTSQNPARCGHRQHGYAVRSDCTARISHQPSVLVARRRSPICHVSAEVPLTVVSGPRRNLKLTWNASAICTVGVPVAQTKGYFDKRSLAVELRRHV